MPAAVRIGIEDGIATVAIDDGKVNALSTERIGAIDAALDAAEKSAAVVVLRGRDGVLSAGFDLATFRRGLDATVEMLLAGARLVERLLAFPHPVLAVCTGHAYPAGAFLLLAADVRLARAGDFRIGLNEVAIGLTVPRFAIELARHRLTPPGFAAVQSARMVDPAEARRLGYVDHVHEAGALDVAARAEAERLRSLDRPSFTATKARVHERVLAALRAAIDAELVPARR